MRQRTKRQDCPADAFACERLEDRVLLSTVEFCPDFDVLDNVYGELVVADLNADGKQDVIGFDFATPQGTQPDSVRVRLNEGGGVFSDPIDSPHGFNTNFWKVELVEDFDADGFSDIIVTGTPGLFLLRGVGIGLFGAPEAIVVQSGQVGGPITAIFADGDAGRDLVVPLIGGAVDILAIRAAALLSWALSSRRRVYRSRGACASLQQRRCTHRRGRLRRFGSTRSTPVMRLWEPHRGSSQTGSSARVRRSIHWSYTTRSGRSRRSR